MAIHKILDTTEGFLTLPKTFVDLIINYFDFLILTIPKENLPPTIAGSSG